MFIRLFFICYIVLITSCDENSVNFSKNIKNKCVYYINDYEGKINDSMQYKRTITDSLIIYDERKNGYGPVYYFKKKSAQISHFTLYNSDSTYLLIENYNSKKDRFEREGSIVIDGTANSKNAGVELVISYHLLSTKVKNIKLEVNGNIADIKTLKNNYYSHIYKSVIYFPVEKERLFKNDIYFIAEFINCDGSIEKIREKLTFS